MVVVVASQGPYYSPPTKLAESDGTAANTSPVLSFPIECTDLRVNTFTNHRGYPRVEACNRFGQAGTAGSGRHWILPVPLPGTLPGYISQLDIISNPRSTISYNGLLYIIDYDINVIQAVDLCSLEIVLFGPDEGPAYVFENPPGVAQSCGSDMELVIDGYDANNRPVVSLYALFTNGDSYGGPWYDSTIVRLRIDDSEETRGKLIGAGTVDVAPNATRLLQVPAFTPKTGVNATYLLTSAIGGTQNPGSGNGAASKISVVQAGENFGLVAHPVLGTYETAGDLTLDFKDIAVSGAEAGNRWLFVMAASYNSNWGTDWTVRQIQLLSVINLALDIKAGTGTAIDLGDASFSEFIADMDSPGYFWSVGYAPDSAVGAAGRLVVGCGSQNAGDRLLVFPVTAAGGAVLPYETIGAQQLYGDTSCVINTLGIVSLVTSEEAVGGGVVGGVAKALVETLPVNVLKGEHTRRSFIEERVKLKDRGGK
jgi:hypothetical protein